MILNNAEIVVKDGFGAHARMQKDYAALAAHYGFEAAFCNLSSGSEKGLVEGRVGFSRRNFCVPMPKADTMAELNTLLQKRCENYLSHTIFGKNADIRTMYRVEQAALFPMPKYRFDPASRTESKVNAFSTVRYGTNRYSMPVKYCGKLVTVKAPPEDDRNLLQREANHGTYAMLWAAAGCLFPKALSSSFGTKMAGSFSDETGTGEYSEGFLGLAGASRPEAKGTGGSTES